MYKYSVEEEVDMMDKRRLDEPVLELITSKSGENLGPLGPKVRSFSFPTNSSCSGAGTSLLARRLGGQVHLTVGTSSIRGRLSRVTLRYTLLPISVMGKVWSVGDLLNSVIL